MSQPPELKIRVKPSGSDAVKEEPEIGVANTNRVDISINNVVCSYTTKCYLNLRRIAMEGMHVEFKKENNMVNMRLRNPPSTASIWSSGKITCTGATTEPDAYKAARRYCRILQKMKFKVRLANYRVVNVLATCSMPFGVDIYKIANQYQKECSYEPELHPGATFKLKNLHATLKLFNTGSITLTAPSVSKIVQAIEAIYPILYENRRDATPVKPQSGSSTTPSESATVSKHVASNGYNNVLQSPINTANITYSTQNCSREFKIENYGTNCNHVMMTGGMGVNNSAGVSSFQFDHQLNSNSNYTTHLYTNAYNMFETATSQASVNSTSSSTIMGSSSSSIGFEFNNGFSTSTNGNGLNLSSGGINNGIHLISANNSAGLYGNAGGGASSNVSSTPAQPYHWFNENVLVDNMFEDFLP
jgi:transcription initiation factor TFIID TATA-box-binding protein